MRVIRKKLNELRNATVTHVSLVDRSASRIPIRVMKFDKEQQMIDLTNPGKMFRTVKAEGPSVAAVVVMSQPEAVLAQVRKSIEASGLKTDKVVKNEDGTLVYVQDPSYLEKSHIVKMSDELLLVMKGFDGYSSDLHKHGDFDDHVAAKGFFGGLNNAFDALYTMVSKELSDAEDPAEAKTEIEDALDKFSAYVKTLIEALPEKAFKMDLQIQQAVTKAELPPPPKAAPKGFTQNDWDKLSDDGKIEAMSKDATNSVPSAKEPAVKAKKNAPDVKGGNNTLLSPEELAKAIVGAPPKGFTQNDWDAMSDDGKMTVLQLLQNAADWQHLPPVNAGPTYKLDCPEGMDKDDWEAMTEEEQRLHLNEGKTEQTPGPGAAEKKTKKNEDNGFIKMFEALNTNMQTLADQLKAQGQQLAGIVTKQETLQKSVDESVRKSEDAVKAIKGTVVAPAIAEDHPVRTLDGLVKKAEDPRTGTFDTGLMSRTQLERARKAGR